ncbi:hypothetical protein ACS2TQ_27135, partial [Bacillus cereus group sp. BC330]
MTARDLASVTIDDAPHWQRETTTPCLKLSHPSEARHPEALIAIGRAAKYIETPPAAASPAQSCQ